MDSDISITILPTIYCGRIRCDQPALSGQVFCYDHTFPRLKSRDPRVWEDLGNGAWRKKSQRSGG